MRKGKEDRKKKVGRKEARKGGRRMDTCKENRIRRKNCINLITKGFN